ncbi:FIG01218102: hypothetical protein [hydrothermal vent metagenome]|uniref:Uncharacterized protein n=1 Tax=hydrothermal vent metagenome TaxID=652676 RepID=A0A3B1A496_9ZZZZ
MALKVDISFGELLDKITILQIKSERISDAAKLQNVHHEMELLQSIWEKSDEVKIDIKFEIYELKSINEKLWDIEDAIRDKELKKEFDDKFIELARAVYVTNDKRADFKRKINVKLNSELVEEKSYADYQ